MSDQKYKAQEFDYALTSNGEYVIHEKGRPFFLFSDATVGTVTEEEHARLFSISPLLFEIYQELVFYYLDNNTCECTAKQLELADRTFRCYHCKVMLRDKKIREVMELDGTT